MASLNQIEANRRNSQKSTGPRTEEGKAVSRFNALKTGIHAQSEVIPGEDPAELEELAVEYHERFLPATPEERFLVDSLVDADWQLRRLRKARAQLWHHELKDASKSTFGPGLQEECPLGHVFDRATDNFVRMYRIVQAAERSYYHALNELNRLQSTRAAAPGSQSPAPELASFRHTPLPDHATLPGSIAPDQPRNFTIDLAPTAFPEPPSHG